MDGPLVRVTYLGWQGWCVSSSRARVLIDPLLVDEVGRGPGPTRVNFMFRQGRRFDLDRLGPVDAVVLSHEHEDHFNIPTLARIDRRIPILCSGLMSGAAGALLAEMGFVADPVLSGDRRTVGDLEIAFFGPDHRRGEDSDEWDTLGYLVRHTGGAGAFFSNVDTPVTREMIAALGQERALGIDPLAFVGMTLARWTGAPPESSARDFHRTPAAPSGDPALDRTLLEAAQRVTPFPGETLVLGGGRLRNIEASAEFLEAELRRLAEHLYGGTLFRWLLSLGSHVRGDRRTYVMVLIADAAGTEWVYEYRPAACDFVQVEKSLEDVSGYLGAVLMWATDLWAVCSGVIEPRAVMRSLVEALADDAAPRLTRSMWFFYHPLRFPGRVLAQYRAALAQEADTPARVFARR